MARVETTLFPEKVETTTTHRHSFTLPSAPYRRLNRRMSNTSNFGWVISRKTSSVYCGNYSDRIEQLLALSPSEYVRKDKERKYKEAGLKNCIQSLTSLLEKALEAEENGLTMDQVSKDAVRNSIKTIKSNFDNHLSSFREPLAKVASCRSIYSLISHTMTKSTLQNSLSPELNPVNNAEASKSDEYTKTEEDSQDGKNSLMGSLSELFEDRPQKDIHLINESAPITICDG
ncbi:unnamed protein product [Callosobruchus maculatus]|nr:unnamed protein product [Callosobruchus maculatus]